MQVLVCDEFHPESFKVLNELGYNTKLAQALTPSDKELAQVNALLIRSRTKITKQLLAKAPELKVIISATAGFDHIDYELCNKNSITVMHTPSANVQSAAELTLGLMLCQLRVLNNAVNLINTGGWRDQLPRGQTLNKKQVGIIGLGKIGTRVAELCIAFGANVSFYDPYVDKNSIKKHNSLADLLAESDIVSLHVPLTQKTKNLISKAELEIMKPNALLINCSRGKTVSEEDLALHLIQNQDFKASLDVFYQEPVVISNLNLNPKQLIGTPHIGAYTYEALFDASIEAANKLQAFAEKGLISDPVPPHAAWSKDI